MTFWKWSQVAATNASADGTINWAEGQSPSSVNDSARAMMAAASKYRDDISGAITTGGSATAYTVTSYQSFDTLAHLSGNMVAFTPHATNTGTCTINVDSLGAKPLRSAPSVELPAGTLIIGTPYLALYNNSDASFYLHGFFGSPVPLGVLLDFTGSVAPNSSFIFPYGQAISRTTYATYFTMVGTTYGSGDGLTTFNVIDMRGRITIAPDDNVSGSAASRLTNATMSPGGTTIGGTGGAQTVTVAQGNLPSYTLPNTLDVGGSIVFGPNTIYAPNTAASVEASAPTTTNFLRAPNLDTLTADITGLTVTGSVTSGGSGTALNKMPPAIIVPKILRVI